MTNYAEREFPDIRRRLDNLESKLDNLENRNIPESTYFKTATRLNETYNRVSWICLVLFGIAQASLTAYVYMHYGREDALYQDMKWFIDLVVAAGLLEFIWICVHIRSFMETISSRLDNVENNIEALRDRRV